VEGRSARQKLSRSGRVREKAEAEGQLRTERGGWAFDYQAAG